MTDSQEEKKSEMKNTGSVEEEEKKPKPEIPPVTKGEEVKYFKTKKIRFGPIDYQIVTQNLNGPCPLIAIVNALVLKGRVEIPSSYVVTSSELLNRLTNIIFSRAPSRDDTQNFEIFENNLRDVLNIIATIIHGLDVNIRFSGVDKFEFTPALSLFDLVSVNLYHVWLPDPQFPVVYDLIKDLNYNDLVVKMFEVSDEAQLLRNFHEESISQITFHGLASLLETMRDGEIAVVFQNNHFSTVLKRRDEIFKLVSDEGLADEPNVIWETFSSVDGDSIFVNADFGNFNYRTVTPPPPPPPESHVASPPSQPIDNSPIEEAVEALERPSSVPPPTPPTTTTSGNVVRSHTSEDVPHPRNSVAPRPKNCEIM